MLNYKKYTVSYSIAYVEIVRFKITEYLFLLILYFKNTNNLSFFVQDYQINYNPNVKLYRNQHFNSMKFKNYHKLVKFRK